MQATNAHTAGERGTQCYAGPRKRSTIRRCPLALLARISANGFSITRQYSRRGGCGSGCTPIRLQALGPVQGQAQMSTWLTTIVINSARMQLRKRSRQFKYRLMSRLMMTNSIAIAERIADDSPSPEDVCRESELREHVRQFLTQTLASVAQRISVA